MNFTYFSFFQTKFTVILIIFHIHFIFFQLFCLLEFLNRVLFFQFVYPI